MPKKTAERDDQSDVEVTPKGEPVDLTEPMAETHAQDVEAQDTEATTPELEPTVAEEAEVEEGPPPMTPVVAMCQFEVAMAEYPNSCLKHMLAEWKSQEREARKFEERQRVRGDIP